MHRYIYTLTHTYVLIRSPQSTISFHFDLTYSMNFILTFHIKTNNLFCEYYCYFYCPEYLKAEMMTSFTLTPFIKWNI